MSFLTNSTPNTNSTPITNTTDPFDTPFRSQVSVAIASVGLLSLMGSLTVISCMIFFKMYKKLHTRIVMYLCIADIFQSIASLSSFAWVNKVPQDSDGICIFQGVMYQIGNVASAIAAAFVGSFLFANIFSFDYKRWIATPGKKFEIISVGTIFGGSLLLMSIGWMRFATTNIPFYTPIGFRSWCWINESYPLERLMLHYTWIFFNLHLFIHHLSLYGPLLLHQSPQSFHHQHFQR